MLNIELAVLQNLEQEEWATLSEISAQTKIQEQAAEQALKVLNRNGIVESRPSNITTRDGANDTQWRRLDKSLDNYLETIVPA